MPWDDDLHVKGRPPEPLRPSDGLGHHGQVRNDDDIDDDDDDDDHIMDRFVEAGGNFIDTADTYWVRFRILE